MGDVEFTPEQQEYVNKLVGEARVKAREQAQAQAAADGQAAKEKAEREALEASAEWEKLAKKAQARVTELEPASEKLDAYVKVVDSILAKRIEALGDRAKVAVDALPGNLSALEKLDWLNKNAELFQHNGGSGPGTPMRPVRPRDVADGTQSSLDDKTRANIRL